MEPRGEPDPQLYYATRSLCPVCYELVPGRVERGEDGVYISRRCPEHGERRALTCSDLDWYERLPRFVTEPQRPKPPHTEVALGCPEDCGLCAQHQQVAGTAAVEISNHCNSDCPACLAQNQGSFELSVNEVNEAIEAILAKQDSVGAFTLSGGEPTIHPDILEILRAASRPEIARIALNSNGRRIAEDPAFCRELAAFDNLYVCLHQDGAGAEALRGVDSALQRKAIDNLREAGVDVVPLILAAQGVNDDTLGPLVQRLLSDYDNVKSVHLSMMTYTGQGGADFAGDPLRRLTIPGALDQIERSSGGALRKADFMPLTMPNPMCAAIGYYLLMDGELTPLIPLADLDRVIECTKGGHFATASPELELLLRETIDRIYAGEAALELERHDRDALLGKFKRLVEALFTRGSASLTPAERLRVAERYIKSVYLLQFMDAWTFDSKRLARCSCQHVLPEGKIVSSCGYYTYHRRKDPRFANRS